MALEEFHPNGRIHWPGNARIAVFLSFDFQGGEDVRPDKNGKINHEEYTQAEYGPKTGIYRILRILASHEVKATFLTCGGIAERYPEAVAAIVSQGHEVAGHGYHHEVARDLSKEEEHDVIKRTTEMILNRAKKRRDTWIGWRGTPAAATLADIVGTIEHDADAAARDGLLEIHRNPQILREVVQRAERKHPKRNRLSGEHRCHRADGSVSADGDHSLGFGGEGVARPRCSVFLRAQLIERGTAFRRAAMWSLNTIMNSGALGVEVVISGKLRTERAHFEKHTIGVVPKSGDIAGHIVTTGVSHVLTKMGLMGIQLRIASRAAVPQEFELKDGSVGTQAAAEPAAPSAPADEGPAPVAEAAAEQPQGGKQDGQA